MGMRGHKAHLARLKKLLGPEPVKLVSQALFVGAGIVADEAAISITTGAVSGKQHVPSKPGEAPNADTHQLSDNIRPKKAGSLKARVESTSDHAMIEFDWGNTAARPHLRPARDKKKDEVRDLVEKAMAKAVKQSRSSDR